jgi:hypothetical protein
LLHSSQKRLKELIGEEFGRKLYNFIHKKWKSTRPKSILGLNSKLNLFVF